LSQALSYAELGAKIAQRLWASALEM
jgi:hypothetical protein